MPRSLNLLVAVCLPVCLAVALSGCSAGSKQGASRGAKSGAVGGLVAGAVGSIFWGGDAVNNALRTAAVGAASGAAVGAMNSAERGKSQAPAPSGSGRTADLSASDKALKAQMGDLNFSAGEELARCRHVSAINRAEKARLRNEALEGLLKVQKIRQEHGMPVLCT